MDEIKLLENCLNELEKMREIFVIQKQASDEQFQMFDNEMTDLKNSWYHRLNEMKQLMDAWAELEAKRGVA